MERRRLRAVIFDWAGTIIDYGSLAPLAAFRAVFAEAGVDITAAEARGPMGTNKHEHLRQLLANRRVAERWQEVRGQAHVEADLERLYRRFVAIQLALLPDYAEPIPGALATIAALRQRGLQIGSSTGYTRAMMAINVPAAERRGLLVDTVVCADDVPRGRPAPDMCHENARRFGIEDTACVVKVDDTLSGIEAGRRAGMWTIGVAVSGNEVGLSQAAWSALSAAERRGLRAAAYQRMRDAGADFVVDDVRGIGSCIETIDARLATAA